MTEQEANALLNKIGQTLLKIKSVYSVSVVKVNGDFNLEITADKNISRAILRQQIGDSLNTNFPRFEFPQGLFQDDNLMEFAGPIKLLTSSGGISERAGGFSLGPILKIPNNVVKCRILFSGHAVPLLPLPGRDFSFTRVSKGDDFQASCVHAFPNTEYSDLAVAETKMNIIKYTKLMFHARKSTIKKVTSENIGNKIRHLGAASYNFNGNREGTIKAVNAVFKIPETEECFTGVIRLNADSTDGDSGACVITENNEVIGIIIGSDRSGSTFCSNLFNAKAVLQEKYNLNETHLKTIFFID